MTERQEQLQASLDKVTDLMWDALADAERFRQVRAHIMNCLREEMQVVPTQTGLPLEQPAGEPTHLPEILGDS